MTIEVPIGLTLPPMLLVVAAKVACDLGSDSSHQTEGKIKNKDTNLVDRQSGKETILIQTGRALKVRNKSQKVDGKSRSSRVNECRCTM